MAKDFEVKIKLTTLENMDAVQFGNLLSEAIHQFTNKVESYQMKVEVDSSTEDKVKSAENLKHICFLNGKPYGSGNLDYMQELFTDYVVTHQMYGKDECEFKIVKKLE